MNSKRAIIIGAGPAGLTAAYELLKRTNIKPIILEKSGDIGGISKTINYKGNRIDIGGHRFFSKSDRVMNWWMNMMPIQVNEEDSFTISYQNKSRVVSGQANNDKLQDPDNVMLVRNRLSRIYFLRKFFTYPIQLSVDTLVKLGIGRTIAIMFSYLIAQLFPRKPEKNLEDFMINRFGNTLYKLFFKDYTEKVWGISCQAISAEWGAQRIKGVSISKAIQHAIQTIVKRKQKGDITQKTTETSLIEQFLYPKFGPGQLWEEVARQVVEMGGTILMNHDVKHIHTSENNTVTAIAAVNHISGETSYLEGDYFFSTMPVQELIEGMDGAIPGSVREVASGLQYRDFITVGILLKQLSFQDKRTGEWKPLELKDTWIYIQEKDVTVGRLQIFNNWSPYMVKDAGNTWIGMEFFTNVEEPFWKKSDDEIRILAITELEKIGLASAANVLDSTVIRVEKTYPAYFGSYDRFHYIREYLDRFENLFLVGRNGMHKYNNSDHSMLTAMVAVDNIAAGIKDKSNIWDINTEQEYHEEKNSKAEQVEQLPKETISTEEQKPVPEMAFTNIKDYIFNNKVTRWYVWLAALAIVLQFVVFKYFYPYAGFINGDSYVYLETAHWNYDINIYPIGYSRFLRLFSVLSRSDLALVAFQYLLLQASTMAFIFTLFYFYRPGKFIRILLLGCMVFNPVYLYLSNYISSDSLFLSLSLIWFTQLLWILYRPTALRLLYHALILFFAFTVRYNALYYPIIAAVALLFTHQRIFFKATGLAMAIIFIGLFVEHTSTKYDELAGKKQFSPFSGWQMANNALYSYRYVDRQHTKPVPARFKKLDAMVRTYFDSTNDYNKHPEEFQLAGTAYMWVPGSPLRRYMEQRFFGDSAAGPLKKWATVGPLYADYAAYLIKEHPVEYAKFYLLPNAFRYYAPPVEFLDTYNTGIDSVLASAQAWFNYKTNKVKTHFKDYRVETLNFYPVMTGIINVVFLLSALSFVFLRGYKKSQNLAIGLILTSVLWVVNFGFSVFASPIALRFQLFPILVFFSFTFLLIEYIWKLAK